jgi:ADP-ribose pyrophosphatase YjhB (NUDIX family)
MVAAINSVLVGAFAGAWAYDHSAHPLRIGSAALLLSGLAHSVLITVHDWLGKRKLDQDGITHAGGVVFRQEGTSVEYLIVRPSDNQFEWVLPKGHIEANETSEQAAAREVLEETGFTAKVLRRLGTVSFSFRGKDVRVEFFLMETDGKGTPPKKRKQKWVSYEDALRDLSHSQSKAMLKRAREEAEGSRQGTAAIEK